MIQHERIQSMMQSFEGASKAGKDFVDSGLKSFASLSKSMQAIAVEATEYSKKSYEAGTTAMEKMLAAKSLDKAIEVQSEYARSSYEAFVAEMTKMSELYADLAKDAYRPMESLVAKAR